MDFDLSAYPSNSTIESATMQLSVTNVPRPGNVSVYKVESAWGESSINAQNKPALTGPFAAAGMGQSFCVSAGMCATVPMNSEKLYPAESLRRVAIKSISVAFRHPFFTLPFTIWNFRVGL